jgi:hypothetical protein
MNMYEAYIEHRFPVTGVSSSNPLPANAVVSSRPAQHSNVNAGGFGIKRKPEEIDLVSENNYWREHYAQRPYVKPGTPYDDFESAYWVGYTGWLLYEGKRFSEVEADLRRNYESTGNIKLNWDSARDAVRDAWERIESGSFR